MFPPPRKVPAAFAKQKFRAPWAKEGNFSQLPEQFLTRRHEYDAKRRTECRRAGMGTRRVASASQGPPKSTRSFCEAKVPSPVGERRQLFAIFQSIPFSQARVRREASHGMPESGDGNPKGCQCLTGAPEKYPQLLRSKSSEPRGRKEATFRNLSIHSILAGTSTTRSVARNAGERGPRKVAIPRSGDPRPVAEG